MLKGFSFYFLSVVVVVLFHGSPVCCRYLVYIYLYIHLLHCFTYLPVLSWLAGPTRQPAAAAAGYIEAIYLYIKATCWATRICVCVCRTVWLEGSNGSRRERERERETGTTRTTAAMRNNVSNVYPPGLEPFRRAHGEFNSSHYNRHPTTSTTPPRINQTEKVKFSDTHTVVVVDVVATF
jgi:hypothetical protein